MLGKIIKYEWKSTYKLCGMMILAIAGVTLLGVLGFILPFRLLMEDSSAFSDSMTGAVWTMIMVMSLMIYIVMLVGVSYGMMIYQGVHFYKTMYSDEGYLTQTLPVTPRQLLVGKTFMAGIWQLLVGVSVMLSVFILIAAMFMSLLDGSVWRELAEMQDEMQDAIQELYPDIGFQIIHTGLSFILAVLIAPFSSMLVLFGALTIGQLSRKYKALMGILAYFGAMAVNMVVNYIVQFILAFREILFHLDNPTGMNDLASNYDGTLIVSLIMGVGMYLIAHHILTKKLNMD
ncbi:MAG: hypothetical protein NC399_04310 [Muribaculum sp.]|nr:hypothetical protein [Muribaculum sp.]